MTLIDGALSPEPMTPTVRYRAVCPIAVLSLAAAVASGLVFLGWLFAAIPLLAIALAWLALRQIAKTPEELTGEGLAWAAMGLAVTIWIVGYGWLWFSAANEAPLGYQQVTYKDLQPRANMLGERVPPAATDLNEKKVYLKGYMMPGRQQAGLRSFLLCPTNGVCTFHFPNPKPTEMIRVTLVSDLVTDYTTRLIGIGGQFHVDPDDPSGVPYSIEVDYLR